MKAEIVKNQKPESKKTYQKPKLVKYGKVKDLTLQAGSGCGECGV